MKKISWEEINILLCCVHSSGNLWAKTCLWDSVKAAYTWWLFSVYQLILFTNAFRVLTTQNSKTTKICCFQQKGCLEKLTCLKKLSGKIISQYLEKLRQVNIFLFKLLKINCCNLMLNFCRMLFWSLIT